MTEDNIPPASIQIPKQLQDVKPEYKLPLESPYGKRFATSPVGDHDGDRPLESTLSLKPPYDAAGDRVRIVPISEDEKEKNAKHRIADGRVVAFDPAFKEKGIFSSVEINSLLLNTGEYFTLKYSIPLEESPANVVLMALCDCLQRGPVVIEYLRFEKLRSK